MKYMGSKNRIANEILPIILKDRKPDQCYFEPFVGGANIIDKVTGPRIGNDISPYLIYMWQAAQQGIPFIPDLITEDDYAAIKANPSNYPHELVGYVGFAMSFGGKWFGGYRRDKKGQRGDIENMKTQSRRSKESLLKQIENLQDVIFTLGDYRDVPIPPNSIIYCDPPYAETTGYSTKFDHAAFWQWCRNKVKEGHTVFVSEYNAPDDFQCVWSKELSTTLSETGTTIKPVEKLFKKC